MVFSTHMIFVQMNSIIVKNMVGVLGKNISPIVLKKESYKLRESLLNTLRNL